MDSTVELKLQSEKPEVSEKPDYARALRVIGQDLSALYPESVEIIVSGADFIVRGIAGTDLGAKMVDSEGVLQKIWRKLVRRTPKTDLSQAPASEIPFQRTYTPHDINRLDEDWAALRGTTTRRIPDIYSLGERLRTIGRLVTSLGGRLLKVSRDMNRVTFQYQDDQGAVHMQEYSILALYKIQQEYYADRGRFKPTDLWKGVA
jgi:hypothetical protein